MASAASAETRVVCAILAAQAVDLRDEIVSVANVTIDFLYQISDAVTEAAETVRDAVGQVDGSPPRLAERWQEVAAGDAGTAVDAFAFTQAQRLDRVSQMAGVLASALARLAASADGFTTDELSTLYVSESQRRIHQDTLPTVSGPADSGPPDSGDIDRGPNDSGSHQ